MRRRSSPCSTECQWFALFPCSCCALLPVFLCSFCCALHMAATGRRCHSAAAVLLSVLCFVVALALCDTVPSDQRAWFGRLRVRFGSLAQRSCVPWRGTDEPIIIINTGQALVDLYTATNGPNWRSKSNWLNGDPCNQQWYGVTCSSSNNSIIQLYVHATSIITI